MAIVGLRSESLTGFECPPEPLDIRRSDFSMENGQLPAPATPDHMNKTAELTDLAASQLEKLRGIARQIVYSPETAEDVVQDALIKAWNNLDRFEPTGTLMSWVVSITKNTALDKLRRDSRRPQTTGLMGELAIASSANYGEPSGAYRTSPEDTYLASESIGSVNALIGQIDPRLATTFRLRFFGELEYEEIAMRLNIPIGTVRSRINRAKKALKELM